MAELLVAVARASRAVALATVLAVASAGCADDDPQPVPHSVVATVGDATVTTDEVEELLPMDTGAPVLLPGEPPPDPWQEALAAAIRIELFALEQRDRRLPVAAAASVGERARALVEQVQQESRPGLPGDDDLRDWYEDHFEQFADVHGASVTWVRMTDEDLARDLLAATAGSGRDEFVRRVQETGAAATLGQAQLDSSGLGADANVGRVAFALREAGDVGLVAGDGGDWWLVRLDALELELPPWTPELAHLVRTSAAWEAEMAQLDELEEELRAKWPVEVREAALDQLAGRSR